MSEQPIQNKLELYKKMLIDTSDHTEESVNRLITAHPTPMDAANHLRLLLNTHIGAHGPSKLYTDKQLSKLKDLVGDELERDPINQRTVPLIYPITLNIFEGERQSGKTHIALRTAIEKALETRDPIVVFKEDHIYGLVARVCDELGCEKSELTAKQVIKALEDHDEDYRDEVFESVQRRDFIAVVDAPNLGRAQLMRFIELYQDVLIDINLIVSGDKVPFYPPVDTTTLNVNPLICTFDATRNPQFTVSPRRVG